MYTFNELGEALVKKALSRGLSKPALLYKDNKNLWNHFGENPEMDEIVKSGDIKHMTFIAEGDGMTISSKLTYLISKDEFLIQAQDSEQLVNPGFEFKVFFESVESQFK